MEAQGQRLSSLGHSVAGANQDVNRNSDDSGSIKQQQQEISSTKGKEGLKVWIVVKHLKKKVSRPFLCGIEMCVIFCDAAAAAKSDKHEKER